MKKPRIAVLGGNGRVGRLLSRRMQALRQAGLVRVQAREAGSGIDWVCDPSQGDALAAHLRDFRPDLVVAFWGVTPQTDGDLSLNRVLALQAIELAAGSVCPRVAITSSLAVYGAPGASGAMTETHPLQPVNAYGQSKVEMEQAISEVCARDRDGPSVVTLRLANVIGRDMLGKAVRGATAHDPVVLDQFPAGDGPVRSYIGPDTLWDALTELAIASLPRLTTFNLANGTAGVAMNAILEELQAAGVAVPWLWRPAPSDALQEVTLSTQAFSAAFPALDLDARSGAKALVKEWLGATGGVP